MNREQKSLINSSHIKKKKETAGTDFLKKTGKIRNLFLTGIEISDTLRLTMGSKQTNNE